MDTVSNKPQIRLETSDGGNKRLDLYIDSGVGTIAADQSAQQLAFRTANSERMRILADGKVGIGTTSPSTPLEVNGAVKINEAPGTSNGTLIIDGSATGNPQIRFYQNGSAKAYLNYLDASDTLALSDGSGNGLHFSPSTQKVGIGTSSPQNKLHVTKNVLSGASYRSNAPLIIENSSDTEVQILSGNSGSGQLRFGDAAANFRGGISYNHGDDSFVLATGGANQVTIHSNGVVSAADGIALGVGLNNTASNVLDDYEEGTWSPVINGTTFTNAGYYSKVGRLCLVHFGNQTGSAIALANGAAYIISGLPFSMIGNDWQYGSVPSASFADASSSYNSEPLTGRQNNSGNIHIANRSGTAVTSSDPLNVSMVYSTN